jgi:hypothetical protein
MFSDHYKAKAGRVVSGDAASAECDCDDSDLPCYDDTTGELCNPEAISQSATANVTNTTTRTTPVEIAYIGLMVLVSTALFRRLLF